LGIRQLTGQALDDQLQEKKQMFGSPRNPVEKEIGDLEAQVAETRKKISALRSKLPAEEIKDYKLSGLDGKSVSLSELFGKHDELILVHNMGPECPYCTLWADGFKGFNAYLNSRAAFALETDIPPPALKEFATKRGWNFKTVSSAGSTLKTDLGFKDESGNQPGVSTFFKKDGNIFRHAAASFGPGDDFCSAWHLLDLLKKGENGWEPAYQL